MNAAQQSPLTCQEGEVHLNGIQALTPWGAVNKDVRALADRIADLEAKLSELEAHENGGGSQSST